MDLRPALQIQTLIKAMTDVVLPAVDPHNKLAQEQARLAIGMLSLLGTRLPLLYRYECDELTRSLALADTLRAQTSDLAAAAQALDDLAGVVDGGRDVLARARAEPSELEAANFALREKIGALITLAYGATDEARRTELGATVTAHAQEQLLRERAWFASQCWEGSPDALPALETLLVRGAGAEASSHD
jgi:hypothetical protein